MNESEKPFVCKENNCSMTFANVDHLNSHSKKHQLSFNLDISQKNFDLANLGDQTPTPTSFFRNCEEVGLFQDLQNVNPFEETFKKALDNPTDDLIKLNNSVINEDTLHTPHIFPSSAESTNSSNNIMCITSIVNLTPKTDTGVQNLSPSSTSNIKEKRENLRHVLRGVLLKKDKLVNKVPAQPEVSIAVLSTENPNSGHIPMFPEIVLGNSKKKSDSIDKIRELNRAAQMRCRNKKKKYYDRMALEMSRLKGENTNLKKENKSLRQNILHLKKIINKLGGSEDMIKRDDENEKTTEDKDGDESSRKEAQRKFLPIAPAINLKISNNLPLQVPVIYNLLPLDVARSSAISISVPPTQQFDTKKKHTLRILRKT